MALVSQSDVEARLQRSLTSEEQSAFSAINSAVQAYVEKLIGSSVESESESSRYYDGGLQHLRIDPCTSVSSVKYVDEDQTVTDTFDTSDYTLEPVNRTVKTMIRYRWAKMQYGMNVIKVTAKFSIYDDEDTRAIVKNAIIEFLISEINNASNIKRESLEGYSIEYASTESMSALSPIKYMFPEI